MHRCEAILNKGVNVESSGVESLGLESDLEYRHKAIQLTEIYPNHKYQFWVDLPFFFSSF